MANSGRPIHNYNFRNTESRQAQHNQQSMYSSTPFVAQNIQKHPYATSGRMVAQTSNAVSPIVLDTPFRPLDSVRNTAQNNEHQTSKIDISSSMDSSILSGASSDFNPLDSYMSDYARSLAAEHMEDMPSGIHRARHHHLANQLDNQGENFTERPDATYRTKGYDAHNLIAMDASPLQGSTANVSAERTLLDQSIPMHPLAENLEHPRNSGHGRSVQYVRPAQSSDFPPMAPRSLSFSKPRP